MPSNCGVDIIEVERVKKAIETGGEAFLKRVFTETEITYCESRKAGRYKSYAARFAAKEAVSKALGTGFGSGAALTDIEVVNDSAGKPFLNLYGKAKEQSEKMGCSHTSISLSHCEAYAVACAIMEIQEDSSKI